VKASLTNISDGVPQVLFITGSRRERMALRSWVGTHHADFSSQLQVTTIYTLCMSVLVKAGRQVGLLPAGRQDGYIRDLLDGQPEVAWPDRFYQALGTQEFSETVREAIAACQRGGLTPEDVIERGLNQDRDEWVSLGRFYAEYLDILGLAGVVDYPELLIEAVQLLKDPVALNKVRSPGSLIVVDGIEDMDSPQLEIVSCLVDRSTPVILGYDPDSQVFGFRGARSRSAVEVMGEWESRGVASQVLSLNQGFGVAERIEDACSGLRRRILIPSGIDLSVVTRYRNTTADRQGEVVKVVFPDTRAEAHYIARMMRKAHMVDGVPYDEMAILVRKRAGFAPFILACEKAGIPVQVAEDEIQLNREPAVGVLLAGLRVVRDTPEWAEEDVRLLESSPMGLGSLEAGSAAKGGSVEEVLWALWNESTWPEELQCLARGSESEALRANRSLDAVVALFSLASTFSDLPTDKGINALCAAVTSQEIPENLPRSTSWVSPAVRLTTAHRAKGRSWSMVAVAGVQEGVWPLSSLSSRILDVEELSDMVPRHDEILVSEMRLLHTACTSSHQTLVLTAVNGDEMRPSAFFDQIHAETRVSDGAYDQEILSPQELVGTLRQVVGDETAHPGLRQAACDRLARLAKNPHFRGADPSTWWGLGPQDSLNVESLDIGAVRLSASQLDTLFICPRQWYLGQRARAHRPFPQQTSFGQVIHEAVQDGSLSLDQMMDIVDSRLSESEYPADWVLTTESQAAREALERYDAWRRASTREVLATEVFLSFRMNCGGPVEIHGRIDRVERDEEGKLRIIDFKTGKYPPTRNQALANIQLGVYQVGLSKAGIPGLIKPGEPIGGAELVYLRASETRNPGFPKVLPQRSIMDRPTLDVEPLLPVVEAHLSQCSGSDYGSWAEHRIAQAAEVIRVGRFPGLGGDGCRYCPFTSGCPVMTQSENS
jgi:superfamily I DNA/RNA helicase/RecB family exonuclease